MENNSQDNVKKALISFVVEQSLLDVGKFALEEVGNRLYEKHQCYFADCLENPQYLREILEEIFGDGYQSIANKIKNRLAELENQKPIDNFLAIISK